MRCRPSLENPCPGLLAKGSGGLPVWAETRVTPVIKPAMMLAVSNFFILSPVELVLLTVLIAKSS
jgi:hypothetical protein